MTGTDEGDDILVILDNPRIPVAAPPARPNHSSRLIGAAPNPFNPRTLIRYELAIAGAVEISVVDARGRVVRHLWVGTRDAGPGQVTWDGTDEAGTSVASATYFVVLRTADAMDTASIVLLK